MPSVAALAAYFLRLGSFGFGGPVVLVAAMQRDLVEARAWVSAEEYRDGVALAQLAPGPLAALIPALIPLASSLSIAAIENGNARLFLYFVKASLVVFGSGLAVIPFLHGGVVEQYRWLTERQFLDAVAVAMVTPGPVVITVAFIGYLVAGPAGACLAALGMFLPTYGVVVLMGPWFRRVAGNPMLRAPIDGVTAAAVGAVVGAVIVLGRRALVDLTTLGIALATLGILWKNWRVSEPLLILGAGALGVILVGVRG